MAPPDTQLGAGPDSLFELVNDVGAVMSKTGAVVDTFDLNAFFQVPNGFSFTDPRVTYDSASARWFASGLSFDAQGDSYVQLNISANSNPDGIWSGYYIGPFSGVLADQPKLGVSSDKVALSWNDYSSQGFVGEETWIIEKADVLVGSPSPAIWAFNRDPTRFDLVPADAQGTSTPLYLVYNDSDQFRNTVSPSIGVVAITGTPATGNVAWTETNPPVAGSQYLMPHATQPWGGPIDAGDNRFLSAFWQDNALWVAGNDRCVPNGDSAARSCLRLIQVASLSTTPTTTEDFDIAARGTYLMYPAVALDAAGNLFFVFSDVGAPKTYASTLTGGLLAGASTLQPFALLKYGQGPYLMFPGAKVSRWGDYSGAAVDPSDTSTVWMAGEYAATGDHASNWGTEIGSQGGEAPPDGTAPRISDVSVSPNLFSPNGDGRKEKTRIQWKVSEGSNVIDTIRDRNGRVVRQFKGFVVSGRWNEIWDGRNRAGHVVVPGTYRVAIQAIDAWGNKGNVAKTTVKVVS